MSLGRLFSWALKVIRLVVGVTIVYSGSQLIRGDGLLSHSQFDSIITGVFIILLGAYCIFVSVLAVFMEHTDKKKIPADSILHPDTVFTVPST